MIWKLQGASRMHWLVAELAGDAVAKLWRGRGSMRTSERSSTALERLNSGSHSPSFLQLEHPWEVSWHWKDHPPQ